MSLKKNLLFLRSVREIFEVLRFSLILSWIVIISRDEDIISIRGNIFTQRITNIEITTSRKLRCYNLSTIKIQVNGRKSTQGLEQVFFFVEKGIRRSV